MHEWMQDYLHAVGDQIGWRLARPVVLRELEDHLQDQCDACMEEGMPQKEAEQESLRQMGDPVEVGRELNAVHRPKGNWEMLGVLLALLTVNLFVWLTVFNNGDLERWLWKPLCCMAAGLLALAVCYHLPWSILVKHVGRLSLPGWIVMLFLVEWFFPDGSSRGRDYLVLLLPLVYGGVLYGLRDRGIWGLLVCCLSMAGMLWFCSRYCLTFAGMSILVVSGLLMTLLAVSQKAFGSRKKVNAMVAVGSYLLMVSVFFRRFYHALHWEKLFVDDFYGAICSAMRAHSRMLGPGEACTASIEDTVYSIAPGNDMIRLLSESDYYLTSVIYHLGWLVAAVMVAAVTALLVWCLCRGLKQPTLWSKLLTCAIVLPMLMQTLIHVSNNTLGFLASAQLPLLSYGNTYRIVDLSLLGLLLSVFRCRTILRDGPVQKKPA